MMLYYESELATLYCGDCLEVMKLLDSGSVHAVITDPPYGIAWTRYVNVARHSKPHAGIIGDEDTSARDNMLALMPDVPAIVFGSFYRPYPANLRQVLVWHKPADSGLVGSTTGFRRDAEPIFLCGIWPVRKKHVSSIMHVRHGQAGTAAETGHPHTKPLALMVWLTEASPGNCVLDPFMGSGSTGVACIKTGRRFVGVELDEKYCEIAAKRIASAEAQGMLNLDVQSSYTAVSKSTQEELEW